MAQVVEQMKPRNLTYQKSCPRPLLSGEHDCRWPTLVGSAIQQYQVHREQEWGNLSLPNHKNQQ
jgi:hypothetical protein